MIGGTCFQVFSSISQDLYSTGSPGVQNTQRKEEEEVSS